MRGRPLRWWRVIPSFVDPVGQTVAVWRFVRRGGRGRVREYGTVVRWIPARRVVTARGEYRLGVWMRGMVVAAVLGLAACGGGERWAPTAASGDPREAHVLAETERFAGLLGVRVRGVLTDDVYLAPANAPRYPGEMVPAAGWYLDGVAYYYRPHLVTQTVEYGTQLAAHEVCHARVGADEAAASACAAEVVRR